MKNERKLGNYENPYEFRRFWDVAKVGIEFLHMNREQFLEAKLQNLERTLQLVLEGQTSLIGKGKGRGKRSQPNASNSSSFFGRFRSSQNTQNEPSTSSSTSNIEDDDPPPYDDIQGDTKRIFVRKIELLLNGSPLGMNNVRIHKYVFLSIQTNSKAILLRSTGLRGV